MATVTRTYTENQSSTNQCTFTVVYSLPDVLRQVSDIRTSYSQTDRGIIITEPSVQVKITGTTKSSFEFWLTLRLTIGDPPAAGEPDTREYVDIDYECWEAFGSVVMNKYYNSMVNDSLTAMSSGIGVGWNDEYYLKESALSNLFGDATGAIPIQVEITSIRADSYVGTYESTSPTKYNAYIYSSDTGFNSLISNNLGTLGVDAPPQVTLGTPTYAAPQYAGLGAYTVPLTTLNAQYGGKIASVKLSVGTDSTTQTYSTSPVTNQTISVVPSNAGPYDPTLVVTDSRGQSVPNTLPQITVNAYHAPSINFDVQRCSSSGVLEVEGEHALVTANISYENAIAELTQPTVEVQDDAGNTVASSATWYETWDAANGVDDAVDWTNYNPNSPVTLYGVVSASGATLTPSESYSISITPNDNQGGNATTITQTLPTSFFTIDFQAGGKEIAFGAPANDDLTDYPPNCDTSDNGLFKCNMTMISTQMVGEIKMWAGNTAPIGWLECDGSEVAVADYPLLNDALGGDSSSGIGATLWGAASDSAHFILPNLVGRVPVGYDSSQTEFNTVGKRDGRKDSIVPYHTHGFTQPKIPNHTHTGYYRNDGRTGGSADRLGHASNYHSTLTTVASSGGGGLCTGGAVGYAGTSGQETNANLQPYAVVKYIICAI